MSIITVKKGYDLPIAGTPGTLVTELPSPERAGITLADFEGLKVRVLAREGDRVKTGTPLLAAKDDERMLFTSPISGKVAAVRLGERLSILEVEVTADKEEQFENYPARAPDEIRSLTRDQVIQDLLRSGLWPLIRQRPYDRIANPAEMPKALFVNAMAQDAFHPNPVALLKGQKERFQLGLDITAKLGGSLRLCYARGTSEESLVRSQGFQKHEIEGPYPAGFSAVHIYHIDPPKEGEKVWYLNWQDILAFADFFTSGRYPARRLVSLAGPAVKEDSRRIYQARVGTCLHALAFGRIQNNARLVSGGILNGRRRSINGFLGFYDTAVCALPEAGERRFLGFMAPGTDRWSKSRAFLSSLLGRGDYSMDTDVNGSVRAFVQTGIYEAVCPVDLLPAQLAKTILAEDIEEMERHGILDCVQCGLCSYVCPSKIEVAGIIKSGMSQMEKANT